MSRSLELDIEVRWGDLDALNHVNNTVFLRYLEEARITYFRQLGIELNGQDEGPVVVNINCNFRRVIQYPATVRVKIEASLASEKRMLMVHTITEAGDPGVIYADAEITAVWIDFQAGRSVKVPELIRTALTA